MGKLLMVGTYATDDPTRATMPFVATSGALERGHEPGVVLMGEAVYLMNDQIVETSRGLAFRPFGSCGTKPLTTASRSSSEGRAAWPVRSAKRPSKARTPNSPDPAILRT